MANGYSTQTRTYLPPDVRGPKSPWQGQGGSEFMVWDSAKQGYVSNLTGKPWHYNPKNPGQPQVLPKEPGGPDGRPADFPKLVTTVQQPEVANFARAGLKALPGQAQATQTAFDRLRQQAQAEIAAQRASAGQAFDIKPTETELRGANQQFETRSGETVERMEAANRRYQQEQEAGIGEKRAELGRYETSAQAVADRAVANAERAYKAATVGLGPTRSTGWSGAQSNRAARIYADVNTPLQAELSQRRMGLIGEEMGLQREYLANEQTQARFNQALNEAFRGNTVQIAEYLQNLRTQLRQMSQQEQMQLLSREADLLGMGQRLRSGEISIAQLLQALERSAVDFTYVQPFNPGVIPPTASYTPAAPRPGYVPQSNPQMLAPGEISAPASTNWYDATRAGMAAQFGDPLARTGRYAGRTYGAAPQRFFPAAAPTAGGRVNDTWVGADAWRNTTPGPGWQSTVPIPGGGEVPWEEYIQLRDQGYL